MKELADRSIGLCGSGALPKPRACNSNRRCRSEGVQLATGGLGSAKVQEQFGLQPVVHDFICVTTVGQPKVCAFAQAI